VKRDSGGVRTPSSLGAEGTWLERTLADLVAIDSVNPTLVPGAAGERAIAEHVAGLMRSLGMEVELSEAASGRVSAVGRLPGAGGGRSLMLNGHLDTVGVEGMERPFEPRIEGGRLYGRGAYDMKGAVAACLAAVKALGDAGARPAGDVVIAAVADEEDASLGTRDVLGRWRTDGAIVVEPTELELALAHKGFVWLELESRGRAAHGSRWDLGVDANLRMGRVLAALAGLEREVRARPPHPLVGPPSFHVGVLEGGTGPSTYAARSAAQIERRTLPGEAVEAVERELAAAIDRARSEDGSIEATLTTRLARPAFEARADGALAPAVEAAAAEVLGRPPARIGVPFWTDAALCAEAGIDTVLIGPVGAGAHETVEWVNLDSCVKLAGILARTALAYCGGH
jgi:acetylornithine deacetylase